MMKEEVKLTNEQKLTMGIEFLDDEPKKEEPIKEEKKETQLVKGIEFLDEPVDSAEKEYLIFYVYADDEDGEVKEWKLITGRKNLYEFIKGIIDTLDLDESFILSDKEILDNRLTVYEFMKYVVKDQNLYPDDDFDIDEYR